MVGARHVVARQPGSIPGRLLDHQDYPDDNPPPFGAFGLQTAGRERWEIRSWVFQSERIGFILYPVHTVRLCAVQTNTEGSSSIDKSLPILGREALVFVLFGFPVINEDTDEREQSG